MQIHHSGDPTPQLTDQQVRSVYHTQAEYCAIPENRVFTLFLATGHQLARYNAFLFAK